MRDDLTEREVMIRAYYECYAHERPGREIGYIGELLQIISTLRPERKAAATEAAPILSKYHGAGGFELERFIADYEAWKLAPPAPQEARDE